MRYLGLDFGAKTVGAALTDELGITVQNLETIKRKEEKKLRQTLARIQWIVENYHIGAIVLGLPLLMDGSEGARAEKTRAFAELLKKRVSLPVYFQDERLTTVEAEEILKEMRVPPEERKTYIDQIAANFILQDFLRNHKDT